LKLPHKGTRAYRIDRIQSIDVLPKPFKPSFPVEFTPYGRFSAPLLRRRMVSLGLLRRSQRHSSGTKYLIECPYCGKKFSRSTRDLSLRPHKQEGTDWSCPGQGRRGYLVDIYYQ
jgi:hypothetical protein